MLIAADEPEIEHAASKLREIGGTVEAVQADLSGPQGVDRLYEAAQGRRVDALLANAGAASVAASWIKILRTGCAWSKPISRAHFCCCRRSGKTCAGRAAAAGFDAMMKGQGDVVTGWHNKLQSAIANITPAGILANMHSRMAEPKPEGRAAGYFPRG